MPRWNAKPAKAAEKNFLFLCVPLRPLRSIVTFPPNPPARGLRRAARMAHRIWYARILLALALLVITGFSLRAQSFGSRAAETGWDALDEGDAEKAAAAFRQALAEQPHDPT